MSCNTARDRNRELSRREFTEGRTHVSARPRILFVELTRHCNLSCPMCREPGSVPPSQRMTRALFDRLDEELFPQADVIDLRGWGESLVLPDFTELAARAARHGGDLRIVTNLSFSRPHVLDLLADLQVHAGVSLDTADPVLLGELRRGARLDLIEANLARLAAAYRARAIEDRLVMYVTCQRPALDHLEDVVALAARAGVRDVRFAPVTTDGGPLALDRAASEVDTAVERIAALADHHGVRASITASLFEGQHPHEDVGPCMHPWTHCYVAYDGRVGFCDHLIGPSGDPYILGSLAQTSFEAIWNGPAWTELRAEHLGHRRADAAHFHECAWCYRNRHLDCEDLLEPVLSGRRIMLRPVAGVSAT